MMPIHARFIRRRRGEGWLYLLMNDAGEFYTGSTQNLWRRHAEHNAARRPRAYTAQRGGPWRLVDTQRFATYREALLAELRIKRNGGPATWKRRCKARIALLTQRTARQHATDGRAA